MSTSPSEPVEFCPGVITKETPHVLSAMLLGDVTAVHWMGDSLIFYYSDGRKTRLYVDDEGDFMAIDHAIPTC
jgi:hypothetical protein